MTKASPLTETDESVSIQLPARQRVLVVAPLTFLAAMSFYGAIWWGYQWLASTSTVKGGLSEISMFALIAVEAVALRILLIDLATTRLVFDRTTIEIKRSVLGVRITRHWYSCYRLSQNLITHNARHPDHVRLDLVQTKGERVMVADNIPSETFVLLTHTIRRKGFAYFQEPRAFDDE